MTSQIKVDTILPRSSNTLTLGNSNTTVALTGTIDGSDLSNMNASNLASGTLPDARFPATLPAVSGANLTNIPTDLVNDTSPQLGGNLDLNSNNITGTGNIPAANLTGALPAIDGSALTGISGGGKIGQVVSTTKTDKTSFTSTSFADVSGLSVSITPTATSSKIYIVCSIAYGTTSNVYGGFRLVRDSTAIAIGDAEGVRNQATATGSGGVFARAKNTDFSFLDSPNTTSATTFKVQCKINSNQTLNINSSGEDENNTGTGWRLVSTITAMEVLA
jgi:hypothetical protein|tara:strand:- start:672 stop:1499 length:828 start_codon:yes stop_codon:yes gene_type:complete